MPVRPDSRAAIGFSPTAAEVYGPAMDSWANGPPSCIFTGVSEVDEGLPTDLVNRVAGWSASRAHVGHGPGKIMDVVEAGAPFSPVGHLTSPRCTRSSRESSRANRNHATLVLYPE